MPKYIGLDVHKNKCHATIMNEDGEIQKQEEFKNDSLGLGLFFNGIGDAKIAMEVTYSWQPIYKWLEENGHEVKLAHPKKARIIAEAKIKTDCRDSEALAHLLRTNLLSESYVPPEGTRGLRRKLNHRNYLVRVRTKFKNKTCVELARRGMELEESPWTKKGRQRLEESGIDEIIDYLAMIEALDERINKISRELKREARGSEEAKLLMTIPGVGYFTALTILAEMGNINRFPDPEKLCSYAGLVPSTRNRVLLPNVVQSLKSEADTLDGSWLSLSGLIFPRLETLAYLAFSEKLLSVGVERSPLCDGQKTPDSGLLDA